MSARFDVSVKFDTASVRARLNSIKAGLGDRAVVSALNKTALQAKTRMSEAIRADYNISASLVRERLRIRKATRSNSVTFSAMLIGNPETGGERRSMNMIHFMERKTSLAEARRRSNAGTIKQLFFKVKKRGGKNTLPGAFIGNKGRTVFIREGKARLPIKAVRTIGVPQMFNTKKNVGQVMAWIGVNFPRIAESEIKFYLQRG
jgi:hypothetical protein